MLGAAAELQAESYFPVSARTGEGLDALVDHLVARAPEGPPMFSTDAVRDVAEEVWVAELVREQLLAVHPRRAAVLDRHPCHRVGGQPHHRRDRRRAGEPEGDGHRQGRRRAQAGRRAGARPASRRAPISTCASRSTRTGSAAPTASNASATERSMSAGAARRGRPLPDHRHRESVGEQAPAAADGAVEGAEGDGVDEQADDEHDDHPGDHVAVARQAARLLTSAGRSTACWR